MGTEPTVASVEHNGFTITSNATTPEAMQESLTPQAEKPAEEKPDLSKAASDLGKEGGKAAAAKRAEAAKEKAKEEKQAKPAEETPAEETTEAKEEKLGKPRDDPKARMLEATRQAAEVKRALATERAERERLQRLLTEKETVKASPAPAPSKDKKPEEGDFDNYADFVEARARFAAREEFATQQRQVQEQTASAQRERQIHETFKTFFGRLGEASKADPTFRDRTVEFVGSLQPTFMVSDEQRRAHNDVADEILKSEHAARLVDHFVEHPEEFQRVASLQTHRDVLREMAKLETKVEIRPEAASAGASSKPEVSKANPPVRPVTGSPHIAEDDGYKPGMSLDDYSRKWKPAKR